MSHPELFSDSFGGFEQLKPMLSWCLQAQEIRQRIVLQRAILKIYTEKLVDARAHLQSFLASPLQYVDSVEMEYFCKFGGKESVYLKIQKGRLEKKVEHWQRTLNFGIKLLIHLQEREVDLKKLFLPTLVQEEL
jgi:hypothetical protein